MIACNLSTPGMATGVELNPAPGAGVGEGDGVGAARTTSAVARLMCAVLSGAPARRWSGSRSARPRSPGGSLGRARPAARSAAGMPARRARASTAGRRRRAGREPRPAAAAAGPVRRRWSPPPAAAVRPGRSRPGTGWPGRAPRPGRASWSGRPPPWRRSARAPGWARPGRRAPRTPPPPSPPTPAGPRRRLPMPPCRAAWTAGPAARPRTRRARRRTATPVGSLRQLRTAAPAAGAAAAGARTRPGGAPPAPAPGAPAGSAVPRCARASVPPSCPWLGGLLAVQPPAAVDPRQGGEHHLAYRVAVPAVPADRAKNGDHLPVGGGGGVRRLVLSGQRRADLDVGAVRRPGVPLGPRRPDRRVGADLAGEARGEPPDRPAGGVVRVGVHDGVRLLQRAR